MKKQKGFTLIELLAVIVILAIIALIATPIVLNLINKARQGAAQDSAYGVRKAAQLYYQTSQIDDINGFNEVSIKFDTKNGKGIYYVSTASTDEEKTNSQAELNTIGFNIDGTVPTGGTLMISTNGNIESTSDLIINGYYCYIPNSGKITCSKPSDNGGSSSEQGDSEPDTTNPVVIIDSISTTTSSITLNYIAEDPDSGIQNVTCKAGDQIGTMNDNTCTINGLSSNTEYTYELTVTNGQNGKTTLSDTIITGEFQSIVINKEPASNTWTQQRTITITGKRENERLEYQIVNSIDEVSDENWTNYIAPITINENKSIVVRLTDGTNTSSAETYTEDHMDRNAPTSATVSKKSATADSITVIANGISEPSGIYGYQFSKDNGATWSEIQTSNEYTFTDLISGPYQIKSRVINNTYEGMHVINEMNSLESEVTDISTETIDTTEPSLTLGTVTSTVDSIIIEITTNEDNDSGISDTVCSATANSITTSGTIENNICTISGLDPITTYSYSVTTTNGVNLSTTRSGNITTQKLTAAMVSYTKYGQTTVDTALDDLFNRFN